ncbi:thioesterase-like superfamily-domain-containing protein [Aspergillus pseudodeflectus]|uniref:Thioesterase-like superfamily-domain-containing protein n=2 Tax=Aspergillus subgen. Nidulantes TaxID=2720870 RepID=A0ABR4K6W2_9EURO|nr:Putative Acyl-CoA thioesterase [Aspergillus calidoustus]
MDEHEEGYPRLSFVELMALKPLGTREAKVNPDEPEKIERFESLAAPYRPGLGTRSFGGHVYAQTAYAASKTVPKGMVIHSMTGTFILPGRYDVPYIYTVRHLRDGAVYCTRAVDARQDGQICFSGICSFKRDEKKDDFNHQAPSAQERYRSILAGKRPEDHPVSPSVDADWWIDQVAQGEFVEHEFPGLDVRKVDMKDYNSTPEVKRSPEKYRQLTVYSLLGSPGNGSTTDANELRRREESGEFDNLYACAHMYSSDKNSLLLIPRSLGIKHWSSMASLTLTVVFHLHGEPLRMVDWDASSNEPASDLPKKWFIQEGWTPRSGENRAMHESWLWSPDGKLLATSYQDSMLRLDWGKL